MEIDPTRVINRLGQRIAELEIDNAQKDAIIQQLVAEKENGAVPASNGQE